MSYVLKDYGGNEIKEHIIFIGDSSGLVLDECYLQVILTPHRHHNTVADDGSTATCTICKRFHDDRSPRIE